MSSTPDTPVLPAKAVPLTSVNPWDSRFDDRGIGGARLLSVLSGAASSSKAMLATIGACASTGTTPRGDRQQGGNDAVGSKTRDFDAVHWAGRSPSQYERHAMYCSRPPSATCSVFSLVLSHSRVAGQVLEKGVCAVCDRLLGDRGVSFRYSGSYPRSDLGLFCPWTCSTLYAWA